MSYIVKWEKKKTGLGRMMSQGGFPVWMCKRCLGSVAIAVGSGICQECKRDCTMNTGIEGKPTTISTTLPEGVLFVTTGREVKR